MTLEHSIFVEFKIKVDSDVKFLNIVIPRIPEFILMYSLTNKCIQQVGNCKDRSINTCISSAVTIFCALLEYRDYHEACAKRNVVCLINLSVYFSDNAKKSSVERAIPLLSLSVCFSWQNILFFL